MKNLIIPFLLLFSLNTIAQETPDLPTFIYKISAEEAVKLYEDSDEINIENDLLYHFVDSFSTSFYKKKDELKGYFLYVYAENRAEDITAELKTFFDYSFKIDSWSQDLVIQILDSTLNPVRPDKAFLNNKRIDYSTEKQLLIAPKKVKSGLLIAIVGQDTIINELDVGYDDYTFNFKYWWRRNIKYELPRRWKQFWQKPAPYRWKKNTKGYIILNQPQYRPNDTLKASIYITNGRGQRLNAPVEVALFKRNLEYDSDQKPILTTLVNPDTKGHFDYQLVLGDSLEIDREYHLYVTKPSKRSSRNIYLNKSFMLKDYQLDEIIFDISATKRSYTPKDKVILKARATNQNGQNITDGRIRLILQNNRVEEIYRPKIYLNDTIWQTELALRSDGMTQIMIPDSIFPYMDASYSVIAEFYNSNGEYQEEEVNFSYKKNNKVISCSLDSNQIAIHYLENGISKPIQAQLRGGRPPYFKNIQLPASIPHNPYLNFYVSTEEASGYCDWGSKPSGVSVISLNRKDSVLFVIQNPHLLPISYDIYKGKKLIESGQTHEKLFQWHQNNDKSSFTMIYTYPWSGRLEQYKEIAFFYKKALNIEVVQPQKVLPGESVPVKIKVKDSDSQPAKSVHLTASAINAAFDKRRAYSVRADLSASKFPKNERDGSFDLEDLDKKYKTSNGRRWYKNLQLDQRLFYRIRFPENGLLLEYNTLSDSFYQKIAQFAPYVVKNGKRTTIHLIYCNGQLKYYSGAQNTHPYSFVGKEGYNKITIRTKNAVYTLDSVLLKNGTKLELSLDENNYQKHAQAKHVSYEVVPTQLTNFEKSLLEKTMFVLRPDNFEAPVFLWQSPEKIHLFTPDRRKNTIVGPFENNRPIKLVAQNEYQTTFQFEGGYAYDIEKNRERLYRFSSFKDEVLSKPESQPLQGEAVYLPNIVKPFNKDFTEQFTDEISSQNLRYKTSLPMSYYKVKGDLPTRAPLILFIKDSSLVRFSPPRYRFPRREYKLPIGDYQMILYLQDSTYSQHQFTLKANSTLYEDPIFFEDEKIVKDTNLVALKTLLKKLALRDSTAQIIGINTELDSLFKNYKGANYISGTVTDAQTGEPLIAATVNIKGTEVGTITDIEGKYRLSVPEGYYEIIISYTGYGTEVTSNTLSNTVNIGLLEGGETEELIILGYSSVKKDGLYAPAHYGEQLNDTYYDILKKIEAGNVSLPPSSKLLGVKEELRFGRLTATTHMSQQRSRRENVIDLRSRFQDYAYFESDLVTDKNGEAHFIAHFPDNITKWETTVVGMDRKANSGTGFSEIQAFKPVTAQVALPRFLVEGDEVNIIGKALNYTNDSFAIRTAFKQNSQTILEKEQVLSNSIIEKVMVTATEPTDSFRLSYQFETAKMGDGEERVIPIIQKGIEENKGQFWILEKDTTIEYIGNETVQLSIQGNALGMLSEDIDYLKNYPYDCNEQTASRLMALLLEKSIREQLNEPFKGNSKIRKMIRTLQKRQNSDGSWGWWENGKANGWITAYVLKALNKAQKDNARYDRTYQKGIFYLKNNITSFSPSVQLYICDALEELSVMNDFSGIIEQIQKKIKTPTLYQKMLLFKLKQAQSDTLVGLDSLLQKMKTTTFGGYYWGEEGYRWFDNSIQLTITAYDIFKKANRTDICKGIERYFLENRTHNGWRNTFESAQILELLLPTLLEDNGSIIPNELTVNGQSVNLKGKPFQANLNKKITLQKKGKTPVYVATFERFKVANPKAKSDIFEIQTNFIQKGQNNPSNLVKLEQNQLITLQTVIKVKQSADYVMIEIPIPAGCSYEASTDRFKRYEVHRAYYKDRIVIFCEELPIGVHTFNVKLQSRFIGNYTVNPAKIEQMYFPIFYGRNELKKLSIN